MDQAFAATLRRRIAGGLRRGPGSCLFRLALAALLCSLAPLHASAAERVLTALEAFPAAVQLTTQADKQSIVLRATYSDGVMREVTSQAKVTLADSAIASWEAPILRPKACGNTSVTFSFEGRDVAVPVEVRDAAVNPPVSFTLDVMPVFMRSGCNSGSCHGAARGKDGFHLSLFGYDPDGDWDRLKYEMAGRRISLAAPRESLLLEKSIAKVNHTGGELFKENSPAYVTILRWLEAGAPKDPANIPKPVSLQILPGKLVVEEGSTHRTTVLAKYSDGTDRDVTDLALFMTSNDAAVKIDKDGVATAQKRGEAYVFARFATFTVGTQIIVIPPNLDYTWPSVPENNYIDQLVFAKHRNLRIVPSELCSDEAFLRRASIDITGQLPTREQYDAFTASQDPQKREKLVDELLSRKEFVELWVMKWAELLQIRSDNDKQVSYKATLLYFNWLQDRVADNVPFNVMVQELLSSKGGTFTNPATNYYQIERDTLKTAENVAQVFMGMRIQCAQCHNHPFDRWTMDDYYGFAAFFSQVGRKKGEDPREQVVYNQASGEVKHPVGNREVKPKLLGGGEVDLKGRDRREVVAQWLASPENPYFARNLSNIVWSHFFGQGIVEPVDDMRISNPPSNPELLDELARRFTAYNYDFKKLVRDICTSRAYQLSTRANPSNETDTRSFARGPIRRVRAEVLLDMITQVTDTKSKFRGLPLGARAVQIADGRTTSPFLTTFGRASRETVCSCEVKMEPNLSQALHLINGDTVNERIKNGDVVSKLLKSGLKPEQVIEELYIRCFTRKPTKDELDKLQPVLQITDPKEQLQAIEDVFWAMLNSKEFLFNH